SKGSFCPLSTVHCPPRRGSHTQGSSSTRESRRGLRTLEVLPLADRHAHHGRFEDPLGTNVAEGMEAGESAVDLESLPDEDEAVAGPYRSMEARVLQAAQPHQYAGVVDLLAQVEITAQLRRRLAHEHARHQRVAGHVAADPE